MKAEEEPFRVMSVSHHGKRVGYDILLANKPFLMTASRHKNGFWSLKRHEAYAICKPLNNQRKSLKWVDKFSDPYAPVYG